MNSIDKPGRRKAASSQSSVAGKITRGQRSRENTRQKLIDAARQVMARKGVDATAIADITTAADVGFGSFYNHFMSKAEIVECVCALHLEEFGRVTDFIAASESDMAVAIIYINKWFYEKTRTDPLWAWFIVHASTSTSYWHRGFFKRALQDVRRGVEDGRLQVASVDAATRIILATTLATMQALLEGEIGQATANQTLESLLRMVGIPPAEAKRLSLRPLPKYLSDL